MLSGFRKFLNSAIGEHGSKMVLKKLSALKTLQKRTNPEASQIFHDNSKWLRKKYYLSIIIQMFLVQL